MLPLLPAKLLMVNQFDSVSKIGDYRGPLLQTHGDADRLIPMELARRLHAAANEPKQFIPVSGGSHNSSRSRQFHDALWVFLQSAGLNSRATTPADHFSASD